jgi:hypothetical protein
MRRKARWPVSISFILICLCVFANAASATFLSRCLSDGFKNAVSRNSDFQIDSQRLEALEGKLKQHAQKGYGDDKVENQIMKARGWPIQNLPEHTQGYLALFIGSKFIDPDQFPQRSRIPMSPTFRKRSFGTRSPENLRT